MIVIGVVVLDKACCTITERRLSLENSRIGGEREREREKKIKNKNKK